MSIKKLCLRYINVRMQIKRNSLAQTYNQKHNNLMQPLLNISKASTPVRTRVVNPHGQLNSTPISINKIVGNIHKSPNNKQNYHSNFIKTESTGKSFMKQSNCENRINLSPILALNRKLNEGPKYKGKKSLTPEVHKNLTEDYEGYDNESTGKQQTSYGFGTLSSLNDSKGMVNYNSASNLNNLRGSNCFKALIESRNKSPNRFEGNKLINKKDNNMSIKESINSAQLFKIIGQQNRDRLSESKSFDQLKGIKMYGMQLNEIKCKNNDGKKAKYRVLNQDDKSISQYPLYYCSKCTIPLVQQGFIVQQIGKQTFRDNYKHPETSRFSQIRAQLNQRKKNIQYIIIQINEKKDNQAIKIDQYYENIIEYLQKQKQSDKKKLLQYYQKIKIQPESYVRQIDSYINSIEQILSNPNAKLCKRERLEDILSNLQPVLQNYLGDISCFSENIEQLTDRFINIYQNSLKFQIGESCQFKISEKKRNQTIQNRNHAMRFSFQKLISENNSKKNIREIMNPLIEEQQDQNEQDGQDIHKQEPTAFRDLFPEGDGDHLNTDIYSPTFKNI